MAIEVNDFVIQAKVIQSMNDDEANTNEQSDAQSIPPSVKQEIIDECMEKVKEYLARKENRF
ncbi:MAG: DUF5908 family protein [bacterium]|nr:DUF5908 family protein [bacterium]